MEHVHDKDMWLWDSNCQLRLVQCQSLVHRNFPLSLQYLSFMTTIASSLNIQQM
jgi:hypothetical protein